jgi:TolA-binding protein
MISATIGRIFLIVGCLTIALSASAQKVRKRDTIESLENKTIEVRPGSVIVNSSDKARSNYRAFLDLVSNDPELRAEAMRRLGDLELEATEAEQLADNAGSIEFDAYDNAVGLFHALLDSYPDYGRNDSVLYQLARAYEIAGKTDDALRVLNDLITQFPDTPLVDEVQFRRGEMLFLRRNYNDAEVAYSSVVDYGPESRFYEQSLYKLGWSQFKLASHEDSLIAFFNLLDRLGIERVLQAVADVHFGHGFGQFFGEFVVDGGLHIDAVGAHAGLAVVAVF